MSSPTTRRDFLDSSARAGMLAGLGSFAFLRQLPAVSAAEVQAVSGKVRLKADIEPLVRLIEETPRDKVVEAVAGKLRAGLSYGRLLAGLMLAGVRSIKPRPVGFKFHAVLVINSAHLASLDAPDKDRWLPLLWALDSFKASQAQNAKESAGWVLPPVEESKLPDARIAKQRFREAMDSWDEEGSDRAAAAFVRAAGSTEVIEEFWRYGARDLRDIGHKAIYVANSYRTLQTIGWRHAEPVVRSLAFALLQHEGSNPAKRDSDMDRPWRENRKRAARIRADWRQGKATPAAATDLLATMRSASHADGCERIVELLNKGVDPASVWDGLFLAAGELLMRKPGIVGVHGITSLNALRYGFETTGNDETRKLLLLQGAAFVSMFRNRLFGDAKLDGKLAIDTLEKADLKASGPEAIEEIFADVGKKPEAAARKTLALLSVDGNPRSLITAGRRLIFTKGTNAHDYKFSSAALEDYYNVTPAWRARYLAASLFWMRGSGDKDNTLIARARAALA